MEHVFEVTDATFHQEVVERSKSILVLVDFWADWCAPCRALRPVLEKLVAEFDGAFVLATLDTENNPLAARTFNVRSIPEVKFFRHGRIVDQFTGALPEPEIRRHLSRFVKSPVESFLDQLESLYVQGAWADIESQVESRLDAMKTSGTFLYFAGKFFLRRGKFHRGREILDMIPGKDPFFEPALTLKALADFADMADSIPEEGLGQTLKHAKTAFLNGNDTEMLDALLEILFRDKNFGNEIARKTFIAMFDFIEDKQVLRRYQRQLSMAVNA